MLFLSRAGGPLLALALGHDHLDDLAPAGDEIGQQPGGFIGHRPRLGPGRLGEVGDHRGIDRVGLGPLADRLGEGADLRRIDHDDRQPRRSQRRRRHGLKAAGGLQRHERGAPAPAAGAQLLQPGSVARDHKRSPLGRTATSKRSFETSIPTVMLSMATRPCLIGLRLAAPATVRVRWNNGRGTRLPHGLKGPRVVGHPPVTAPRQLRELGKWKLQGKTRHELAPPTCSNRSANVSLRS